MTSDTLESTRRLAGEAMHRANATIGNLRASVQEATGRGLGAMGSRASAARGTLGEYTIAGRRYVGEHPLKSALVAAAVGVVIAGVIIALRNRDDSDSF